MELTSHQQELWRAIASKSRRVTARRLFEQLCRIGVVDHTLCKVLAVRTWVDRRCDEGYGKVKAMWMAAEHFSITYELVRQYIYYYKDINV
jgi:hypothetical protein